MVTARAREEEERRPMVLVIGHAGGAKDRREQAQWGWRAVVSERDEADIVVVWLRD
jgi:hypothetical protein